VTVSEPEFAKLDWRPEINGLRAVAVVPVVLYHFQLCPGGFAGVDVFFVLSGFLVTSILLHELSVGIFSMKRFWLRRTRRLFPAMSLMLAILLAISWNLLLAPTYARLVNQTLAVLLMGANVYFYNENDYFTSSLQDPLLHGWSLAIEEQYYLLIPVLLRVLWYLGGKLRMTTTKLMGSSRHSAASTSACAQNGLGPPPLIASFERGQLAFAVTIMLLLASLTACIALQSSSKKFAFYLLPLRAWEMLLGSALAFDRRYNYFSFLRHSMAATEASSAVGLAMILASFAIYSEVTPWPSYPTLLPTIGTALFLASQEQHPNRKRRLAWCGKLLTLPPFTWIGEVTYSLYLWHWPIYVLFAYTTVGSKLDAKAQALGILVSTIAACASFLAAENALIRSSVATSSSNQMLSRSLRTLHLTRLSDRRFTAFALIVWSSLFTFAIAASFLGLGGVHPALGTQSTSEVGTRPLLPLIGQRRPLRLGGLSNRVPLKWPTFMPSANQTPESASAVGLHPMTDPPISPRTSEYCMDFLSKAAVDQLYTVRSSLVTENSVLASTDWNEPVSLSTAYQWLPPPTGASCSFLAPAHPCSDC
jgi:peptidoglycan/LPS O-acetylase OafA/YrhL